MKFEKHIDIDCADKTAVDILSESTDLSRQAIKRVMKKGAVWLTRGKSTHRIRRADKTLKTDDCLHIYYDDEVLDKTPDVAVLIADEDVYSIWRKPYGMLSQGSKWGDHCTINRWVEKNIKPQRSAFITHRLDRAATGLMIIAHQKKTAAYFSELFKQRQIEKRYQAIVHGEFPQHLTLDAEIDDRPAVSHVSSLDYSAEINQSLVEVSIETGRKHQIRKHLSAAGFPIAGDRLYGCDNKDINKNINLCLNACYLSFLSPVNGDKKTYVLPENMLLKI